MNRIKILLGYLLSFILTVFVTILSSLIVIRLTFYNKEYVKNILNNSSYYENISKNIITNMEDYMVSSGLPDNILDNLFTINEVRDEINNYIDGLYNGKIYKVNVDIIKERLDSNIDKYLDNHSVKVTSQSNIESFIKEMSSFYEKEISFYHNIDKLAKISNKLFSIFDKVFIISIIIVIVLFVIVVLLKVNYKGSIFFASSLILLFIRMIIYDKIDIDNILIVSDNFSKIIKVIIHNFDKCMLINCFVLGIFGLLLIFISSFIKKDAKNV